ncbi:MAG: IspD/TarI family cytidylyltransferase [Lachnospirales bacterium]
MNTAILLSGGVGERLKLEVPKQYIVVNDKMIITYSIQVLVNNPLISQILIVAEEKWRNSILDDAIKNGIEVDKIKGFAQPGFNRQASIISGMNELVAINKKYSELNDLDLILIHDAARPLVTEKQITECINALDGCEGVMPVLPMKDTVYFSEDGKTVHSLLKREKLFSGQAPEVFNLKKYYDINKRLLESDLEKINGSTEAAVLGGMHITMIPGDEENFKITTKNDLERFKKIKEKK